MGRIAEMCGINVLAGLLIILIIGGVDLNASESDITITEFRQLYDICLPGKRWLPNLSRTGSMLRRSENSVRRRVRAAMSSRCR
jgi:hypothetical protein